MSGGDFSLDITIEDFQLVNYCWCWFSGHYWFRYRPLKVFNPLSRLVHLLNGIFKFLSIFVAKLRSEIIKGGFPPHMPLILGQANRQRFLPYQIPVFPSGQVADLPFLKLPCSLY
ncbi:hypothetical protein ES708_16516 [subsurface metagenome]